MSFFTLRWQEDGLALIDQLELPTRRRIQLCRSVEETADAIRDMVVRGAPAIGVTAAYGLVLALNALDAWDEGSFDEACERLAATRPTAVNLFWAIERMREVVLRWKEGASPGNMESLRASALAEARRIETDDLEACKAIGRNALPAIPSGARILTHCNAGGLATSGYGTALGVIRAAHEAGRLDRTWVDETRPYLQGARLTAWELQEDGIPYTLICDNMAASLMAAERIDLVVVGADRITAKGDVANKIGTYGLAVLCHHHGIPFYVAAPVSTIDLALSDGASIPIEERPARELTHIGRRQLAPDGARVYNPGFDVTPHRLITAIVTEVELLYPPFAEGLKRAARP